MHQCDYCCWYNPAGYCDCPLVMRKKACKSAIKTKERTENKVVTSKAESSIWNKMCSEVQGVGWLQHTSLGT